MVRSSLKLHLTGTDERYSAFTAGMGARLYQPLETRYAKSHKSSDLWGFGMILCQLCAMAELTIRQNSDEVQNFGYNRAISELLEDPVQRENVHNLTFGIGLSSIIVPFVLLLRQQCLKFCADNYPQFLKIVQKCLYVEGRSEKNVRGTFGELICSFEEIREEFGWSLDGPYNRVQIRDYFPQFRDQLL